MGGQVRGGLPRRDGSVLEGKGGHWEGRGAVMRDFCFRGSWRQDVGSLMGVRGGVATPPLAPGPRPRAAFGL